MFFWLKKNYRPSQSWIKVDRYCQELKNVCLEILKSHTSRLFSGIQKISITTKIWFSWKLALDSHDFLVTAVIKWMFLDVKLWLKSTSFLQKKWKPLHENYLVGSQISKHKFLTSSSETHYRIALLHKQ